MQKCCFWWRPGWRGVGETVWNMETNHVCDWLRRRRVVWLFVQNEYVMMSDI